MDQVSYREKESFAGHYSPNGGRPVSSRGSPQTFRTIEVFRSERLALWLYVRYVFWPLLFETIIRNVRVADHVGVMNDQVIARTRFEKFLLIRQPGCFINPDFNFRNFVANVVGFWSEFQL